MDDGRADAPGLDSAHGSRGPDLQPWLNGPRLMKVHSTDLLKAVSVPQSTLPATQHTPPVTPAMLEKSSPQMG